MRNTHLKNARLPFSSFGFKIPLWKMLTPKMADKIGEVKFAARCVRGSISSSSSKCAHCTKKSFVKQYRLPIKMSCNIHYLWLVPCIFFTKQRDLSFYKNGLSQLSKLNDPAISFWNNPAIYFWEICFTFCWLATN